ncbi:MAG: hypothetical protein KDD66_17465 [Bdellovibrionales bacterium]|nr:hypothetical protein [Bdellovibrionales bacterium]
MSRVFLKELPVCLVICMGMLFAPASVSAEGLVFAAEFNSSAFALPDADLELALGNDFKGDYPKGYLRLDSLFDAMCPVKEWSRSVEGKSGSAKINGQIINYSVSTETYEFTCDILDAVGIEDDECGWEVRGELEYKKSFGHRGKKQSLNLSLSVYDCNGAHQFYLNTHWNAVGGFGVPTSPHDLKLDGLSESGLPEISNAWKEGNITGGASFNLE